MAATASVLAHIWVVCVFVCVCVVCSTYVRHSMRTFAYVGPERPCVAKTGRTDCLWSLLSAHFRIVQQDVRIAVQHERGRQAHKYERTSEIIVYYWVCGWRGVVGLSHVQPIAHITHVFTCVQQIILLQGWDSLRIPRKEPKRILTKCFPKKIVDMHWL